MEPTVDEAMLPLGGLFSLFGEVANSHFRDETAGMTLQASEMTIETPVELYLTTDAAGRVVLGGAPPLYTLATTLQPVFHQLRLTLQFDDVPNGND